MRSHYIPYFLLEGFKSKDKYKTNGELKRRGALIYQYSITPPFTIVEIPIKKVCVRKDFYTKISEDGSVDDEEIENKLTVVERSTNQVIRRLRGGASKYSADDHKVFTKYVSVLLVRANYLRSQLTDFFSKNEQLPGVQIIKQSVGESLMISNFQAKIIENYIKTHSDFEATIQKMSSRLIDLSTWPTDLKFIIGDNAIGFTRNNGISAPKGEVILPVSSNILIWWHWRNDNPELPGEKFVDYVNQWSIRSSEKFVYASHKSDKLKAQIIEQYEKMQTS